MSNEPIAEFQGEYRFLSNFWITPVEYEGIVYPSSEHAFQAAKSLNTEERLKIAQLKGPKEAKAAGYKVTLRPDWETTKDAIMFQLLEIKFRDPVLRQKLLDTGDRRLIEGNHWGDFYWGVCGGRGQNKLGALLMLLREVLKGTFTQPPFKVAIVPRPDLGEYAFSAEITYEPSPLGE